MEKTALNLSDLKGNPHNPRFIKEANAQQLKASLAKLGDLSCIVFNERTGQLVGGHQRKNVILQLIGENPQITITHTNDTPNEVQTTREGYILVGTEHYKVRFVDFSEQDEALALIVANDDRNKGEYDMQLLPTAIDIASGSILSVDFDLMDFAEWFNFDLSPTNTEDVEFEADTENKKLSFNLSKSDYERTIARFEEVKTNMSLDTDEEAFLFLLFA